MTAYPGGERRATTRFKVGNTTVVLIEGVRHVVRIRDVSYGGLGVLSGAQPPVGSEVVLDADGRFPVDGKVVRLLDGGFAVSLEKNENAAKFALRSILPKEDVSQIDDSASEGGE